MLGTTLPREGHFMIDSDSERSSPAVNITQEALYIAQLIAPTIAQEDDLKVQIPIVDYRPSVPDYNATYGSRGNVTDVDPKQSSLLTQGFSPSLKQDSAMIEAHMSPSLVRVSAMKTHVIKTPYHHDHVSDYIPAYGSVRTNEIDDLSQNSSASPYGNFLMQKVFGNSFSNVCSPSTKGNPNTYEYFPSHQ